jgi:putative zinc finger/helix-turn-helix YgiT family protein
MKCIECGHEQFERVVEREQRTIDGREFSAGLPADECSRCGEIYVEGEALANFEKLVAGKLAQEGPASGEAFRFLRKAIALKAADLAALLGVTPETISRWENGQREVDMAAWATLAAIVVDSLRGQTLTIDRLRAAAEKPSRRVEFGDIATPESIFAALLGIVGPVAQVQEPQVQYGSPPRVSAPTTTKAPKRPRRAKEKRR